MGVAFMRECGTNDSTVNQYFLEHIHRNHQPGALWYINNISYNTSSEFGVVIFISCKVN